MLSLFLGVDASPLIEDLQCRLQLNSDDSITALVQFTVSVHCGSAFH